MLSSRKAWVFFTVAALFLVPSLAMLAELRKAARKKTKDPTLVPAKDFGGLKTVQTTKNTGNTIIPRIFHFVWVGGELPRGEVAKLRENYNTLMKSGQDWKIYWWSGEDFTFSRSAFAANMQIAESLGTCSDPDHPTKIQCEVAGETWMSNLELVDVKDKVTSTWRGGHIDDNNMWSGVVQSAGHLFDIAKLRKAGERVKIDALQFPHYDAEDDLESPSKSCDCLGPLCAGISDIFRAAALYEYGGIYADIGDSTLGPHFLTSYENYHRHFGKIGYGLNPKDGAMNNSPIIAYKRARRFRNIVDSQVKKVITMLSANDDMDSEKLIFARSGGSYADIEARMIPSNIVVQNTYTPYFSNYEPQFKELAEAGDCRFRFSEFRAAERDCFGGAPDRRSYHTNNRCCSSTPDAIKSGAPKTSTTRCQQCYVEFALLDRHIHRNYETFESSTFDAQLTTPLLPRHESRNYGTFDAQLTTPLLPRHESRNHGTFDARLTKSLLPRHESRNDGAFRSDHQHVRAVLHEFPREREESKTRD